MNTCRSFHGSSLNRKVCASASGPQSIRMRSPSWNAVRKRLFFPPASRAFRQKSQTQYGDGIPSEPPEPSTSSSDGVSAALFQLLCEEAGVPFQRYANRADMAGGSTLGNIANTQVSLNTVDIGLPQLAMHSAWETAGAEDTSSMVRALTVFYGKSLELTENGLALV